MVYFALFFPDNLESDGVSTRKKARPVLDELWKKGEDGELVLDLTSAISSTQEEAEIKTSSSQKDHDTSSSQRSSETKHSERSQSTPGSEHPYLFLYHEDPEPIITEPESPVEIVRGLSGRKATSSREHSPTQTPPSTPHTRSSHHRSGSGSPTVSVLTNSSGEVSRVSEDEHGHGRLRSRSEACPKNDDLDFNRNDIMIAAKKLNLTKSSENALDDSRRKGQSPRLHTPESDRRKSQSPRLNLDSEAPSIRLKLAGLDSERARSPRLAGSTSDRPKSQSPRVTDSEPAQPKRSQSARTGSLGSASRRSSHSGHTRQPASPELRESRESTEGKKKSHSPRTLETSGSLRRMSVNSNGKSGKDKEKDHSESFLSTNPLDELVRQEMNVVRKRKENYLRVDSPPQPNSEDAQDSTEVDFEEEVRREMQLIMASLTLDLKSAAAEASSAPDPNERRGTF